MLRRFVYTCLLALGFLSAVFLSYAAEDTTDPYAEFTPTFFSAPEFLTFDELVKLSKDPKPSIDISRKVEKLFTTPIVSNEAFYRGARPRELKSGKLKRFLRVASWNIEKSIEMKNVIFAFTDKERFRALIDVNKASADEVLYKEVMRQRTLLESADIILLQEMDIGHKRSGYLDAPRELANALDMNYTYGPAQLEVDPAYLGTEKIVYSDGREDMEAEEHFRADPARYRGMFGSAVLSKYPIKRVELFQLKAQAYDWYTQEKKKLAFLEHGRRFGVKSVFLNEMFREIKVGGRVYFRVDLHVPGLPEDTLTVINIHLEIKCMPKGREEQIKEILAYIRGIRHPVIMAGDFNSAPGDLSPTSFSRVAVRAVKDPQSWLSLGVNYLSPQPLFINSTRTLTNLTKNLQDPFAADVAVVAPNKVKKLFKTIEQFRFDDGLTFDFRGDVSRSVNGRSGILSNANQRDLKGFKTTFSVRRSVMEVIGKYRLDWFFVKSFIADPHDPAGSYRLAPHFGETLEELNTVLISPLSDHHPSVIELPLEEPAI